MPLAGSRKIKNERFHAKIQNVIYGEINCNAEGRNGVDDGEKMWYDNRCPKGYVKNMLV